jgi:hypothetical protein
MKMRYAAYMPSIMRLAKTPIDVQNGIENPRVGGSIPSLATIEIKGLREIAGPFSLL